MIKLQEAIEKALPLYARPFGFIFAQHRLGYTHSGLIELRDRHRSNHASQVYFIARGFSPDEKSSELLVCKDRRMKEIIAEGFYLRDENTGAPYSEPVPRIGSKLTGWQKNNFDQKLLFDIFSEILDSHTILICNMELRYPGRRENMLAFDENYPRIVQNKFDHTWRDIIDLLRL